MNTRTNPNYPFKKSTYNKGMRMIFNPLERAAKMADAEIKKSRKKSSYNKDVSQARTKEEKERENKIGRNMFISLIIFAALFLAISIPTGFIDSNGAIVVLIIGVIISIFIGAAIPIKD